MSQTGDLHGQETMLAIAIASAINRLLKGYDAGVAGTALGLALGEWVAGVTKNSADQEKLLDSVLVMTAAAAKDANA